ncbi:MAG: Trm112 family protein [Candidatus Omnitrophota bacterium]
MAIDNSLLETLACPACRSKVVLVDERIACTNRSCGLSYPIRQGIPVMLVDEALPLKKPIYDTRRGDL